MTNSKQSRIIKQTFEKIFLEIDEKEIDHLTTLEFDELVSNIENEYGKKFSEKFSDNLLCLITKEMQKENKNE